jgi:hypothetical protein
VRAVKETGYAGVQESSLGTVHPTLFKYCKCINFLWSVRMEQQQRLEEVERKDSITSEFIIIYWKLWCMKIC